MGTLFRVTLYAADEQSASVAKSAAFARAKELDEKFTDYRDDSELMRLSARAGEGPIVVSGDLYRVLDRAQDLARVSDGAFDVTIGPVVRLWRLSRRTRELPPVGELDAARSLVGRRNLTLDAKASTAELLKKGMRLDLGGIAKGFAADEMAKVLRSRGVNRALVAAGGDIVALDPPPDADGWRVAVAGVGDEPRTTLLLKNAAVSTSGDAEQFVEIGGTRYSHIVNPRTGIGLTVRMAVTVTAPDATTSDALATACAVIGPEQAMSVIEKIPGTAVHIVQIVDKKTEARESPRFGK